MRASSRFLPNQNEAAAAVAKSLRRLHETVVSLLSKTVRKKSLSRTKLVAGVFEPGVRFVSSVLLTKMICRVHRCETAAFKNSSELSMTKLTDSA